MKAQHVHNADGRQTGAIEIGSLGHARADKESAVAAALDGKLWRGSVFLRNKILAGGDEIVEAFWLVLFRARAVQTLAVFTAAAQVGHGEDPAHLHPHKPGHAERRRERDAKAAVAIKQRRIAAVFF